MRFVIWIQPSRKKTGSGFVKLTVYSFDLKKRKIIEALIQTNGSFVNFLNLEIKVEGTDPPGYRFILKPRIQISFKIAFYLF